MELRVFVNDRLLCLPPGSTVRDALTASHPELLDQDQGPLLVTDGRGIALALDAALESGAIVRARRSSRQAGPPAHGGD
jgi:hypothetical protein